MEHVNGNYHLDVYLHGPISYVDQLFCMSEIIGNIHAF
jgi:hypothetical protein